MCTYMYLGCGINDVAESVTTDDGFLSEMLLELIEDKTERKYPTFPHPPLLVAVGTRDAVVVRWRSFESLLWPVERFVLQRYPGRENQAQWSTLLNENTLDFVDVDVEYGRRYGYRVQAISSDNATSAYEYQWTRVDRVKNSSGMLRRSSQAVLDSIGMRNLDGFRSLGLLFACFLTLYGLMRANVMGVQGTQSRSSRLKQITKSSKEVTSAVNTSVLPRRSSMSISSTSPSVAVDPGQRSSMFDVSPSPTAATAGGLTRGRGSIDSMMPHESAHTCLPSTFRSKSRSIGASVEIATGCEHCGKVFGFFRKRYVCDICHSVSLCRKCGFQASVDSFANARTGTQSTLTGNARASIGGRGLDRRRSSQHHQKNLTIRTICRKCCDDVYRYSTHASVRPSYVSADIQAKRF